MRTVEFGVLDEDDRPLVERLAVGLGRDSARVLAYLLLRAERGNNDDPATRLTVRVGTGLNRTAVGDALGRLEERGVVSTTAARTDASGRPPKAWYPTDGRDATVRRVHEGHAAALCRQARSIRATEELTDHATPEGDGATADHLTLGLNWHPNGLHVPFYAALDDGYANHGISVDIDHHEGSRRALESVVASGADVGLVGAATLVRARANGAPVVALAVPYQRAMTVLYTTREAFGEPLDGIEQLRGRRIGAPRGSETGVLARLFLSRTAVADAIEFVDTAGEEQRALLSGAADVITGSFADPRQLERRGMTVDSILVTDHFPIYGPTLVVHERLLAERPSLLERFLAGTMAGWASARGDPDAAVDAVAAQTGESSDRVRRTFEHAIEEFAASDAVRAHGWGWQRTETWDRLRTALAQGDLLRA